MAKFCGKCGTQLRDTATFCDSCGAKCAVINAPAPQTDTTLISTQVAPTPQNTPTVQESDNNTPAPPSKKKSKKGLIVAIIAAVLVVAITLTTIFVVLPMFKKGISGDDPGYTVAGKDFITFKSPDTRYYISGLDYLDINRTDISMSLKALGADIGIRNLSRFVSLGDCAYTIAENNNENKSNYAVYKVTYADPSELDYYDYAEDLGLDSVPIIEKWLTTNNIGNMDELHASAIMFCSYEWQYSDGYIYFYIYPSKEVFEKYSATAYKFGRINTETKGVEYIAEDIAVSDYVVYDGWVYYCDNGRDQQKPDKREYIADRAGLYKMRTDGSERTKLLSFKCENELDYRHEGYSVYSELSVYNGKLYYIDNTDPFNSILHRMNLDGSNIEKISQNVTYEYTFDKNTNKLYYITGSLSRTATETKDIYEVDLENISEHNFANYSRSGDRIRISCINSVLYFSSPDSHFGSHDIGTEDNHAFIGIYYNLNSNKATAAYKYGITETTYREFMGQRIENTIIKDFVFYWADYDPSDGLFTFYK